MEKEANPRLIQKGSVCHFFPFLKKKCKRHGQKLSVLEKLFCLLKLSMLFFFDVCDAVVVVLLFN